MASEANPHGRVDDDGTVLVHDRDTWRPVGSFPDGTPAEALAYFERKFQELEAKVTLAEQRLAAKAPVKDLAAQIDKLTQDLTEPAAVGDLGALRHRAQTLQDALPALVDAQKQESEAALQEALATRETIVKAMEELAAEDVQKIRWKAAGARITELFDQWQKHQQTGPRIPKKTADVLWARFRTAKNALEKARRSHFQELEAKTKESKNVKKALIEQAEALAPQGSSGIAAYQKLLTQWKAAPRAQRSVEDALWAKFKAAGDVLYQQKAEQDAQEDKANAGNLELKLSLISDFGDILTLTDRDVATTRLRLFHEKFSAIGPVPKKDMRSIDQSVKKFDTHVRTLDQEFWSKNDPEKKARSSSMAEQLVDAIADLEARIGQVSGAEKSELEAELETKKAWLAVVEG
ncbi:MAG: DUF349 domain-containing protein [Actinobacteria bacterium]|nr:DUF349 domain-containing protein [Actinomycetota bacterium]